MLKSKKLLIAAVCCAFAGHCSVTYGMNENGLFATSSQPTTLPPVRRPSDKDFFFNALQAARSGSEQEVLELIDEGANVNARGDYGETALTQAIENNCPNIVDALLAKGADVNAKNDVNVKPDAKDYSNFGSTALMVAVWHGNMPIVQKLLSDKNIDLNVTDRFGNTALMVAVTRGFCKTRDIKVHGANTQVQDATCYINIVKELMKATIAADKAANASGRGGQAEEQASSSLPSKVNSLNIQNTIKYTVLHYLMDWANVSSDYKELNLQIKSLILRALKAGADKTIKNRSGKTPADLARDYGIVGKSGHKKPAPTSGDHR